MNWFDGESHTDLVAEITRLTAANDRLRSLLGLDERADDGHAMAWSPSLLSQTVPLAPVDASSPNSDKLALLRSLFGGRSDVYATRWENASTGKAGWSPATRGGWSRQRVKQDYLPLIDDVFAAHLLGRATVGIYPLLPGDTCNQTALDRSDASERRREPRRVRRQTRTSRRCIDLADDTMKLLAQWRRKLSRDGLPHGADDWMFLNSSGRFLNPESVTQLFGRIVKRTSALPPIRFHDLRHTHASLLIMAGVPIKVVSERLGHSHPAVTMHTYQHLLPGMSAAADAQFAALIADPGR